MPFLSRTALLPISIMALLRAGTLCAQAVTEGPSGYKCTVLEVWTLATDGHLKAVNSGLEGEEFIVDTRTGHVIGHSLLDNYADRIPPKILSGVGAFMVVTHDRGEPYTLRIDRFTNRDEIVFMYHRPLSTVLTGLCTVLGT